MIAAVSRAAKRPTDASPSPGSGAAPRPHTAFARKYRPLRFEEVVGQEAVGRTIRGAIRAGEIPSTFLFAGPRGVGKTTMARLLAKALNCTSSDGPTPDPCGTCAACTAIADGSALDVVEVDAASHNGVDDVREIRERVAHLPAGGRFKVYILDEAHMFSTAAWNAFLKTLEEPPRHARFIFATTEPEKVPETILSRCQRFDFRRIQARDIVKTLRSIVDRENAERVRPIEVGDPALAALARYARGGLRDAESLLEQAILAGEGKVVEEDLAALLGTVPRERVREILARAAAGDGPGTLGAYADVHDAGADAATFLGQALELLREVTAVSVGGPRTPLVEAEDAEREALAALAGSFGPGGSLRATQVLAETLRLVKATDEERPLVEAGLLRVALGGRVATLPEVLQALASLEARLANGGAAGAMGGAAPAAESSDGRVAPGGPPPPPRAAPPPTGGGGGAWGGAAPAGAPPAGAAAPGGPPRPPAPSPRAEGGGESGGTGGAAGARAGLFGDARPAAPGPNAGDGTTLLTLEQALGLWPRVVEGAKARTVSLGAFLAPARPVVLSEDSLTLGFPAAMGFHRAQCEEEGRRRAVEEVVAAVFGRPLRLLFETLPGEAAPAPAAAGGNGGGGAPPPPAAEAFDRLTHEEVAALQQSPPVRALEKEFRVRMVKVGRSHREEEAPEEAAPVEAAPAGPGSGPAEDAEDAEAGGIDAGTGSRGTREEEA